MLNNIATYEKAFSNLHVKIVGGRKFPNKAILLISVMDLVRCGYIVGNKIELDDTIRVAFEYYWKVFVNDTPPTVWTPFWHMKKEFFWHFKPIHTIADIDALAKPGETASIRKMKREIEYAYLDSDLFALIQKPSCREQLFSALRANYLE